jgi:hypothetical protein
VAVNVDTFRNFTKAYVTWVRSDATLVSLTGYTGEAEGDVNSIFAWSGDEELDYPCLPVQVVSLEPEPRLEIDTMFKAEVRAMCFALDRSTSLAIASQFHVLASQNITTYADASFESDGIKTKSIHSWGIYQRLRSLESYYSKAGEVTIPSRPNVFRTDILLDIGFITTT